MLKAQGGDNNMTSRARARLIKEAAHKRNQIGLLCLLLHPPRVMSGPGHLPAEDESRPPILEQYTLSPQSLVSYCLIPLV